MVKKRRVKRRIGCIFCAGQKTSEMLPFAWLHNPHILYALLDREFNFIRVNEAYARADGKDVSFFPGKNHFDLYPSDAKKIFEQVVATKEVFITFARPFVYDRHPERGHTYWDWTLTPLLNKKGDVERLFLTLIDRTERFRSEEILTSFFSLSTDIFLIITRDGAILRDNGKLCRFLGVADRHSAFENLSSLAPFIHPDDLKKSREIFLRSFRGETMSEVEICFICADGVQRWISWSLSLQVERGCMYCVGRNITDRKHVESELEKSNEQLSNLLSSITDLCFSIDRECRLTYLNDETERTFGRPRSDILGKRIVDLIPTAVDSHLYREYHRAVTERRPISLEEYAPFFKRWYGIRLYPTRDGLLVYARDITEQKEMFLEMARLDRLHLIGQMASGIGHEIRNPLTTVRGFLQLLETKHPDSKAHYDLMISELDRANTIITEFLSLSKTKPENLGPQNLNRIIDAIFPMIQAHAFRNDKEVILDLTPLPDALIDEKEIRQVLLNLVQNALDATAAGGKVIVRTLLREPHYVTFAVTDSGPGIHPDTVGRLGTPFFTTKAEGTGLGLAVSYNIINRHGGKIELDTGSRGTTFYVHLPCQ
ncbi:PAS domain-containing protein [Heliobacterium gestii]|uniref:histidine kinase n=1 Tax=Heliomicrobium gestii TaxID=2699 RepID=A0A845LG80_HELGE|nr:PAS domain-containing protein [Heliomicrobium gestii]MBM7867471.1 PAS domain S-box-containing protein [Heliomicrobium gestii]MZP43980.1 PAS domain-containing protein [Heliomicrobium gestii]